MDGDEPQGFVSVFRIGRIAENFCNINHNNAELYAEL